MNVPSFHNIQYIAEKVNVSMSVFSSIVQQKREDLSRISLHFILFLLFLTRSEERFMTEVKRKRMMGGG